MRQAFSIVWRMQTLHLLSRKQRNYSTERRVGIMWSILIMMHLRRFKRERERERAKRNVYVYMFVINLKIRSATYPRETCMEELSASWSLTIVIQCSCHGWRETSRQDNRCMIGIMHCYFCYIYIYDALMTFPITDR